MLSWLRSLVSIGKREPKESSHEQLAPRGGKPLPKILSSKLSSKNGRRSSADEGKGGATQPTDYVLEAKRLFVGMGLALIPGRNSRSTDPDALAYTPGRDEDVDLYASNAYRNLNMLYQYPVTKGCIFVGNERAASNLDTINKYKITSVVNCTRPARSGCLPNYHYNTNRVRYYEFPIALWDEYVVYDSNGDKCKDIRMKFDMLTKFLLPFFQFIEKTLKRGENILIHCLAGAHRAGTASILCLMHFSNLGAKEATDLAKSIRPVIDPISDFPLLLELFEKYRRSAKILSVSDPIPAPFSSLVKSAQDPAVIANTLRAQADALKSSVNTSATMRLSASLAIAKNKKEGGERECKSSAYVSGTGNTSIGRSSNEENIMKRQRARTLSTGVSPIQGRSGPSNASLTDLILPKNINDAKNAVASGRLKESSSFHVDRSVKDKDKTKDKRRQRAVTFEVSSATAVSSSTDLPSILGALGGPSPLEHRYSYQSMDAGVDAATAMNAHGTGKKRASQRRKSLAGP